MGAKNVAMLGQVFTPPALVSAMLALRGNSGRVLEPSCGDGAFSSRLDDCVAIEADAQHAPPGSLNIDFFSYPVRERFATIIGNPPYVRYQDIQTKTRRLLKSELLDQRANLYLYFIEKSIRHLADGGELIFVTPRDFLKASGSARLNEWLYAQGSITHALELGDARVFAAAVPNCLVWRYVKGDLSRSTQYAVIGARDSLSKALGAPNWEPRKFVEAAGQLLFMPSDLGLRMKDIARVKVGAVSGADDIYADSTHGTRDFVCSHTVKTGETRRMIWISKGDPVPEVLLPHKKRLIRRSIRAFDESNWWQWGRSYPASDAPRVYVNGRTRESRPFYVHDCMNFDGAVLAIFPLNPAVDIHAFCAALNAVAWQQMGFVCDGRYLFAQRSLENAPLPEEFAEFLPEK